MIGGVIASLRIIGYSVCFDLNEFAA